MSKAAKIALFGGTFDPIHSGHLELASQARQRNHLDRVLFIPCRQSPHKEESPVASEEERCRMIELALDPLPWADISRVELDREGESFSWQTAEHFSKQFPDAEIYWILGGDQWSIIDTWAEPDKLRENLIFIVAMRHGEIISPREGWRHLPVVFDHPASATAIRSGEYEQEWLPPEVAEYIAERRIYP